MSGYKLMYNTPNGGKGSLGLIKNCTFNNSMCDGIYLKQRVPPYTTETELFISQGSVGYDSAGTLVSQNPAMCVYVTKPVDEYITVVINYTFIDIWGSGETVKSTKVYMLPPQKDFAYSEPLIWTAYCTFNDVYIYVGKRLAYKFEGDTECKNFKDTYFGARKADSFGITTGNTHKGFPLTCNNETLYVFPLCKDFKLSNNNDNKISSLHIPAFRYKGEIYYPIAKISNKKEDVLNKAIGYIPSFIGDKLKEDLELSDEDIMAEDTDGLGDTYQEDSTEGNINSTDFEAFWGYMWSDVQEGGLFVGDVRYEQVSVEGSDSNGWVGVMLPYIFSDGGDSPNVAENGNMIIGFDSSKFPDGKITQMPLRDEDGKLSGYILVADDGHGNILAAESIEKVGGNFINKSGSDVKVKINSDGNIVAISENGDLSILGQDGSRKFYQYTGSYTDPETGKNYDSYIDNSGFQTDIEEGFWD